MLITTPARQLSAIELIHFLNADNLSFQHLDWIVPRERISEAGCMALQDSNELVALISCEPETPQSAWLRFFYSRRDGQHAQYFAMLFAECLKSLSFRGINSLHSIAPQEWYKNILLANRFEHDTQVVTLIRNSNQAPALPDIPGLVIRTMTARDLPLVVEVDSAAFPSAWQMNPASMQKSYRMASHATVALISGALVGYQISTTTLNSTHLARLAVRPEYQAKRIGTALVIELIQEFLRQGVSEMTVNTKVDNPASLSVYRNLGFVEQEKLVPVLKYQIS